MDQSGVGDDGGRTTIAIHLPEELPGFLDPPNLAEPIDKSVIRTRIRRAPAVRHQAEDAEGSVDGPGGRGAAGCGGGAESLEEDVVRRDGGGDAGLAHLVVEATGEGEAVLGNEDGEEGGIGSLGGVEAEAGGSLAEEAKGVEGAVSPAVGAEDDEERGLGRRPVELGGNAFEEGLGGRKEAGGGEAGGHEGKSGEIVAEARWVFGGGRIEYEESLPGICLGSDKLQHLSGGYLLGPSDGRSLARHC